MFVFPLDFRHRQKTIDQILAPARERMTSRRFIFDDIATLEPARAVHRREPAADMTQQSQHPPHHRRSYFPHLVWTRTETFEHLAHEFPVMPFLVFDLLDAPPFFRIAHRMPVAAIGITRPPIRPNTPFARCRLAWRGGELVGGFHGGSESGIIAVLSFLIHSINENCRKAEDGAEV